MTFGVFDVIKSQHHNYLKEAKKQGKKLITIITSDTKAKKCLGKSTIHNVKRRKRNVEEIGIADIVEVGDDKDYFESIKKYKPSVIVLENQHNELIYELGEFLFNIVNRFRITTIYQRAMKVAYNNAELSL